MLRTGGTRIADFFPVHICTMRNRYILPKRMADSLSDDAEAFWTPLREGAGETLPWFVCKVLEISLSVWTRIYFELVRIYSE